jgi:hypothetical protein
MQSDGHQGAEVRFRQAQAAKLVMQRGVLPNQTAAESIGSQGLRTVSVAHPLTLTSRQLMRATFGSLPRRISARRQKNVKRLLNFVTRQEP